MTNNSEHTVIDHIDNITVPGIVFGEPSNEYWALTCLKDGMEYLYRQAKNCDDAVREKVNPKGDIRCQFYGNSPEFQGIPMGLLTCSFQWYAISACNYVRTVGEIVFRQDSNSPRSIDYVNNIIPEVLYFRDKVAAHFAWSTKNDKDNDAERLVSILPPLTFIDDSFYVGTFACSLKKSGIISNSNAKAWSICKVHEELRKRYWRK